MQNLKRFKISALLVFFSILAFGCQSESSQEMAAADLSAEEKASESEPEAPNPEVKNIFVGPEKVECVGVGPQECYQIKEDLNSEWQFFYDQIEGFEWVPGYTYELRVAVYQVENPPADASSLRYELIEVVDKVETPMESEKPSSYITIETPAAGTEVDASKPIKVSGTGAGLFEGNVVIQILDAAGNELALKSTILQSPEGGMGGEGLWEIELSISIETPADGKIVAFSPSPKDGESWMASDEVMVAFTSLMVVDVSFENIPWILRSFPQQAEINSLLAVYPVTALFNPGESQASGSAGCNRYFGNYQLVGDQIHLPGPVGTTRMMCPEPQMVLENAYLAALEKFASYGIAQNTMEIRDDEGDPLLVFQVEPFSLSNAFTREELANTTYLNAFAKSGEVLLVDGMYREPVAEGSATELVVMMTTHAAFGDITGYGAENAVVVLVSQPGGSGSFYDLAVVRKQGDTLTNLARIQLGDRVQIQNMVIENHEIIVEMLMQGIDDPMCCPTQFVRNYYGLENGRLVLLRSEAYE